MVTKLEQPLGYVPHFDVTTVDGERVRYDDIWQRRNLVLVAVVAGERDAARRFASRLRAPGNELDIGDTSIVVTDDAALGLPAPTLIIADRWGEIVHRESPVAGGILQLSDVDEVLSWVQFVRMQCPECPP